MGGFFTLFLWFLGLFLVPLGSCCGCHGAGWFLSLARAPSAKLKIQSSCAERAGGFGGRVALGCPYSPPKYQDNQSGAKAVWTGGAGVCLRGPRLGMGLVAPREQARSSSPCPYLVPAGGQELPAARCQQHRAGAEGSGLAPHGAVFSHFLIITCPNSPGRVVFFFF